MRIIDTIEVCNILPLPKGRGRGIQIHAPHPGRSGFDAEQRFDHLPGKKMDVSGISLSIGIPCIGECKNNSKIRHTQKDAGGSLLQCAVSRQGMFNIGTAQSMLLQDVYLSGMATCVNRDGWYLIHADMNASFARNSQWNMQSFAHHSVMHASLRRAVWHPRRNSRGSCGGISYRGGERAGLF